jgi:hypothetical protein
MLKAKDDIEPKEPEVHLEVNQPQPKVQSKPKPEEQPKPKPKMFRAVILNMLPSNHNHWPSEVNSILEDCRFEVSGILLAGEGNKQFTVSKSDKGAVEVELGSESDRDLVIDGMDGRAFDGRTLVVEKV